MKQQMLAQRQNLSNARVHPNIQPANLPHQPMIHYWLVDREYQNHQWNQIQSPGVTFCFHRIEKRRSKTGQKNEIITGLDANGHARTARLSWHSAVSHNNPTQKERQIPIARQKNYPNAQKPILLTVETERASLPLACRWLSWWERSVCFFRQ